MVDIAIFDMYYLLVEVLLGSILWAGAAMCLVYIIVMSLFRVSAILQIFILLFFIIAFGTGYGGAIFVVIGLIVGIIYFSASVIMLITTKT